VTAGLSRASSAHPPLKMRLGAGGQSSTNFPVQARGDLGGRRIPENSLGAQCMIREILWKVDAWS
jgi:hypothetical protein